MGTGKGCVRGNERKRMHSSTGKDAEMSREPRAQTESDGEDVPSPQQRSIVSSPEGSDIFLQSLLAVLISLHMSRMKIEFVWRRGGWNWLDECLWIVCARLALSTLANDS